jgi:hypothetical protein
MNPTDKWIEKEYDILKKYYGKITAQKIADQYLPHRSVDTIRKRANILGLKSRFGYWTTKYFCNNNYFDEPNIENSYWAGYIAADGCISQNKEVLKLVCSKKDSDILINFKEQTMCSNDIEYFLAKKSKKYDIGKEYPSVQLLLCGKNQWINNLEKYWNLTPAKSLTLKPPNLSVKEHIMAYIIGYMDGDGGICKIKKTNIFNMYFCGTWEVLSWIRFNIINWCPDLIWNDNIRKANKKSTSNTYRIVWAAQKGIFIHRYLRENILLPYRLSRKWEISYD